MINITADIRPKAVQANVAPKTAQATIGHGASVLNIYVVKDFEDKNVYDHQGKLIYISAE